MARHLGARSNTDRSLTIGLGPLHNNRKSDARQLCPFVANSSQKGISAVPTLDQNIGDQLIENRTPSYREQMILAFLTGIFCKVFISQPFD